MLMKKFLLFTLVQFVCLLGMAQTSDNPLAVTEGENVLSGLEGQGGFSFFKFEAGETDKVLKVSVDPFKFSWSSASTDAPGSYVGQLSSAASMDGNSRVYMVPARKTLYLQMSVYNGVTEVTFNASWTEGDAAAGTTQDLAFDLNTVVNEGSEFYLPSMYCLNGSSYDYSWMKYTADSDCRLTLKTFTSLNTVCVREGEDGADSYLTCEWLNDLNCYAIKYDVKAGTTYYFSVYSYSNMVFGAEAKVVEVGAECDKPFEGVATGNVLPAAAGTYWYEYVAEKDGFLTMPNAPVLEGGTVSVWAYCNSYSPETSVTGAFAVRHAVTSGNSYKVKVEKTVDTGADESFDFVVVDPGQGDSKDDPFPVDFENAMKTPLENGTYYYKVEVPQDGKNYFINVKVPEADATFSSWETSLSLRYWNTEWNDMVYVESGTDFKAEAVSGRDYYLLWELAEGINNVPFFVTLSEIQPGEVANTALPATLGENTTTGPASLYYTYTATKACWLVVDADADVTVSFLEPDTDYHGALSSVHSGTTTKMIVSAGQTCLLKFEGLAADSKFTLSEVDLAAGESADVAVEITEGEQELPSGPVTFWYSYKAPKNGRVNVTSDILQETFYDPWRESGVWVYNGDPTVSGQNIYNWSTSTYDGNFSVHADDVLYIKVVTLSEQEGKKLALSISDFQPGEDLSCPIELTVGENTIPLCSYDNPVWCHVKAFPGELSVTANAYLNGYLYKGQDLELISDTFTNEWDYDLWINKYYVTYNVTEADDYYFKFVYNYGSTAATVVATTEVVEGANALPETVLNHKYAYVAPKAGKLTVSSDLAYESQKVEVAEGDTVTVESGVWVYAGSLEAEPVSLKTVDETTQDTLFVTTLDVEAGDTLYFNVVSLTAQEAKTLTLDLVSQGDVVTWPIELVVGENVLPAATAEQPVWCHLNATYGDVTLTSDTYLNGSVFKGEELELVADQFQQNEAAYYLTFVAKEAADYYFKLDNNNTESTVTVTFAPDAIESVTAESLSGATAVFDMSGRQVSFNGKRLPAGIYVVKTGNECRKVLVK